MHYRFDFGAVLRGEYLDWLLSGLGITMELFLLAWALSFLLAVVLAVLRLTGFRPAEWLVGAYVEYHRNVPLLVQLLFWYFAAPELFPTPVREFLRLHGSEFPLALVALVLCAAAYVSEDLRSGVRAIPRTQIEAGRALGLSYLQTARLVVIPQAVRISAPSLINQALLLFKNTSLAMAIGVAELTYQAKEVDSNTFKTFETFGVATVAYLLVSFSIMYAGSFASKRFAVAGARK